MESKCQLKGWCRMRRNTSRRQSTTRKQPTTRRYGIHPGFTLVLSWLAQKWQRRCHKLVPRGSKNPEQYLTKEQQKACLDSAAAELNPRNYAATVIELATKTVLARSRFAVALLNLVSHGPHDASGGQPDSQHHRTAP